MLGFICVSQNTKIRGDSYLKMVSADFYWEYDCVKTQKNSDFGILY